MNIKETIVLITDRKFVIWENYFSFSPFTHHSITQFFSHERIFCFSSSKLFYVFLPIKMLFGQPGLVKYQVLNQLEMSNINHSRSFCLHHVQKCYLFESCQSKEKDKQTEKPHRLDKEKRPKPSKAITQNIDGSFIHIL